MAEENYISNNLQWANNLRFIATIFVIVIHVVFPVVQKFNEISLTFWHFGNFVESISRCAVPLFVMLSGALLLGKEESLNLFFKKRVSKIIPPFIFWSIVYLGVAFVSNFIFSKDPNKNLIDWIIIQLKEGTAYHLWYIYMILGLYLAIPLLSKMIKQMGKKEFYLFLGIWGITLLQAFPIFNQYFPNFDLTFFTGYVGYLVLGYFLAQFDLSFFNIKTAILLILIGWILTAYFTYCESEKEGKYVGTFYRYLSLNVSLISIGIFMLFKNWKIKNTLFVKLGNLISNYSFGIYLNHVLIITILYKLGLDWSFINPILGSFFTFIAVLVISTLIVFITDKLRLRKILG